MFIMLQVDYHGIIIIFLNEVMTTRAQLVPNFRRNNFIYTVTRETLVIRNFSSHTIKLIIR